MKLLAIDFETTGLTKHPDAKPSVQPRAIELAGVVVDGSNEILKQDVWLFNPKQKLDEEIVKITGLTDEDLRDKSPFEEYVSDITALFDDVDVLVAHNLPFDAYILTNELRLCNRLKDWRWPSHMLCTVQLFEELWGYRPSLIDLYEDVVGQPYHQTHRALDDVLALTEIIRHEHILETYSSITSAHRVYLPPELCPDNAGRCTTV